MRPFLLFPIFIIIICVASDKTLATDPQHYDDDLYDELLDEYEEEGKSSENVIRVEDPITLR